MNRAGTLLIVVAGLSAMLAALGATYLSSLRSRTADNERNFVDAQARLLLYSACAFITERNGAISIPPHLAERVFPFFPHDHTLLGLPARHDCPSDTWFRIVAVDPAANPIIFNVTVGIGLTRGVRTDTEAGDMNAQMPEVAAAVGLPSSTDRDELARREHLEFYQVNWSVGTPGHVTTITRLSTAPTDW